MGNEFFWFLDILVVAVVAANFYRGAKKGAVAVLISSLSAIIAFIIAFAVSGVMAESLYDSLIREPVGSYMDEKLGGTLDNEIIKGLSDADMSKALIRDKYLSELTLSYDEKNTAMIDLSLVDLTETGIQDTDLSAFGIGEDFDYSQVKVGHISVTASEVEKYGLENIVLSHIIASNLTSGSFFDALTDIGNKFSETLSLGLKDLGNDLSGGSRDAVYKMVVSIITVANETYSDRIMNDIITPMVLTPLKIIIFLVIFTLVVVLLNIIANASKVINRIPIVSSVNGVLGALLGLIEAVVVLAVICMVIKFLIAMCGENLVFINTPTIEKTFIFRYIYSFDPLRLIGIS